MTSWFGARNTLDDILKDFQENKKEAEAYENRLEENRRRRLEEQRLAVLRTDPEHNEVCRYHIFDRSDRS